MKKHFAVLCAALIVCTSFMSVSADKLSYEKEARILYDLGLYKGVNESIYEPNLDANLTREEAAVILVRLFGQQDEVENMSDAKVEATLAQFADAYKISEWAKKEVAYSASNGYIKGTIVNDEIYFNPQGQLKGLDYACLILQQLNITDFGYNEALEKLESEGIITSEQKEAFNKNQLNRDDVVGISYNVLKKNNKNKTVIQNLVDLGRVSEEKAVQAGLIYVPTQTAVVNMSAIPCTTPSTVPQEPEVALKRANNAVRLGYWTLTNERREDVNVNRIWFTAEYTGQVAVLKAEDVTDFSVEDRYGNVYAVFSDINGNPNDDIKTYVIAKKRVELAKPFVIPGGSGTNAAEKELFLYGRIKDSAVPGGMIEIFLGDGSNIYEAKGTKSDADIRITGVMMKQKEDGRKIVALSKVIAKMGPYVKEPIARANVPIARVELINEGFQAIKIKQLRFRELINSTGKITYTLRNEEMDNVATAIRGEKGEIIFQLNNGGEKIAGLGSELFTVQLNDKPERSTSIQLKLLAEGTYYDSSDDKGYEMNIDSGVLLDETVFKK